MENIKDIRPVKAEMRKKVISRRKEISKAKKLLLDTKIKDRLLSLDSIINSETVLIYVSSSIEIATKELFVYLIEHGHRVAVPRCEGNVGEMNFYYIKSYRDLEKGSYGIYEPKEEIKNMVNVDESENMTCVVPGFIFDSYGYRIGYGKGYYDRFLKKFKGTSIGLCYEADFQKEICHGKFDRTVNAVVTEKEIYTV